MIKVACSVPTNTCGAASRRALPTTAMSPVVRAIRSPVPARSTTEVGSASVRSTNSSRSRASARSAKRWVR
jgi:hypothetical protein